jgi:murein DD-endopeptidase MepM/ murein hydrolase activator NlpD
MREGPDVIHERVAQFTAGRQAQLLARHEDWVKVDVGGVAGWVHADLLDIPAELFHTLPETADFPAPPPIWVWPTHGAFTSGFGPRWGGFHNGIDIANRSGTPIVAARSGRVVESGWCSGYGYCVKMTHDGGISTVYGHLVDQPVVGIGETVKVGDIVGYMGSTYDRGGGGYSTGVHLHFEIRVNGRAVNPLKFLP